jgi:hypothetical protein
VRCATAAPIATSAATLHYLSWAFYGDNQHSNAIHKLLTQHPAKVWAVLKARKDEEKAAAFVMALCLRTRSAALVDLIRLSVYCCASRLSRSRVFRRSIVK